MSSSVLLRRRSERYAQLLDEASGARRHHHTRSPLDDELAHLVELAHHLTDTAPPVAVDEEFRRDTRAFLMAVAERDGIGKTAKEPPAVGRAHVAPVRSAPRTAGTRAGTPSGPAKPASRFTTRRGRIAILAGLAVGTLALSGISAASGDAKPGDTLYALKREQENMSIQMAGSDVAKGRLYLQLARKRLAEATAVDPRSPEFASVLHDMDTETMSGAKLLLTDVVKHKDATTLTTLNQFLADQGGQLAQLTRGLPAGSAALTRSLQSTATLDRVVTRADDIDAALRCSATTAIGPDSNGLPDLVCHQAATVTPNSGPKPTGGRSTTEGAKPGSSKSPVPTAPTTPPPSAPAGGPVTPSPSPTDDGGLLGIVEHLLSGL